MSYSICSKNDQSLIATSQGWKQFKEFIDTIPSEETAEIKQLIHHGVSQNADQLWEELDWISENYPLQDNEDQIQAAIKDFIQNKEDEDQTVFISDGTTSEDEEDDPACEDINF